MAARSKKPIPEWTAKDAAPYIYVPTETDDKYSHGVLGMVTGSKRYPGAAILGVEAAHHTGVGMIRYLGPRSVAKLVLLRRPEVVTVDGRVNAWVIGSGADTSRRGFRTRRMFMRAIHTGQPIVMDAGALDLVQHASGRVVITPHARELASLLLKCELPTAKNFEGLEQLTADIRENPGTWCELAADQLGAVVVLKGNSTHIAEPQPQTAARFHVVLVSPTTWLATAGSGDVLAGILGALLATHNPLTLRECGELAATAVWLHGTSAGAHGWEEPFPAGEISSRIAGLVRSTQGKA